MKTKTSLVHQCLAMLKQEDIKKEIRILLSPLLEIIYNILNPYIYFCLIFVFVLFIMILANLILMIYILRFISNQPKHFI
jgi:hypothetical protein